MTTARKKAQRPATDEKSVATYLSDHPDFLLRHPDMLARLTTPARALGEGVSDFQRFMVDRLKTQVQELRATQQALIAAGRANDMSLGRIHGAALRLVEAGTLEELGRVVSDELPALCDVDCALMALEGSAATPGAFPSSILTLEAGTVERWLGPADTMLQANTSGMPELFGAAAPCTRSFALMRLEPDDETLGVVAFGSRDPEWFTPDQGTDLVTFLTGIIARQVRRMRG